jgi:hypothetical protein
MAVRMRRPEVLYIRKYAYRVRIMQSIEQQCIRNKRAAVSCSQLSNDVFVTAEPCANPN